MIMKTKINNSIRRIILQGVCCAVLMMAMLLSVSSVSATKIYLYGESENAYQNELSSYVVGSSSTDYKTELGKYSMYVIQHDGKDETRQMYLKKGALRIVFYGMDAAKGAATIYKDAACTDQLAKITLTQNSSMSDKGSYVETKVFDIPKSQMYFVKFNSDDANGGVYQFFVQQYDGTNRTLTSKKILSYVAKPNGNTYYKVNIKKAGYMTVKPEFYDKGNVAETGSVMMTLLDANKKAISKKRSIGLDEEAFSNQVVYAVNPGTYYIKASSEDEVLFSISCKQKAITSQAGKKRTKAKTIKVNTWYESYMTWDTTTTEGDYYKFTLKKSKTVTLTLKGNVCSGKIVGDVSGDSINGQYDKLYLNKNGQKITWAIASNTQKKLPAGTYTIRIGKDTKNTNGYYKIKFSAK